MVLYKEKLTFFMFNVLLKVSQMFSKHDLETPFLGYTQCFMNIFEDFQS